MPKASLWGSSGFFLLKPKFLIGIRDEAIKHNKADVYGEEAQHRYGDESKHSETAQRLL